MTSSKWPVSVARTVITRLKVTDKSPDNEQENRDRVAVFCAVPPPNPNS